MGVSGNEELGRAGEERSADRGVVVAGIAADVLDKHVDILALEAVQLTIHEPQVAAVAVAADGAERTEGGQTLGHLHSADIACMPYLVAGFEVMKVLLVPIAMGVADDSDSFSQTRQ